jgi:hypothetical protein
LDSDAYASHVPLVPPLQQPLGHVLASHAHTPVVRSHRLFAQEAHAAPPLPHCEPDCEVNVTHALPLQHPFAHDVASHTHAPVVVLHSWPVVHTPQAAPAEPHVVFDSDAYGTHVLPLQHPFGHEVASQTHCPPLHLWSVPHAAHAAPPLPHDAFDSLVTASQVEPLQHPEHEVVPPHEHTPAEHVSPVPQAAHAAPAAPQSSADWEDGRTQLPALQQPVGHEVASHTHLPVVVLHSCPVAHALQAAPAVPHEELDSEASGSQTSPLQQPRQVDGPQPPPTSAPTSGKPVSPPV